MVGRIAAHAFDQQHGQKPMQAQVWKYVNGDVAAPNQADII